MFNIDLYWDIGQRYWESSTSILCYLDMVQLFHRTGWKETTPIKFQLEFRWRYFRSWFTGGTDRRWSGIAETSPIQCSQGDSMWWVQGWEFYRESIQVWVSYLLINDNHVIYMYVQYLLHFVERTHIKCEKLRWQISVREPIAIICFMMLFINRLCHFGAKHVWKFSGCKNRYLDIIIVAIYLFL